MTEHEGIVEFKDWQKLDLRVGIIENVEDIENADKLYKLEVDLGKKIGKRTIAAGIKERRRRSHRPALSGSGRGRHAAGAKQTGVER